MKKYKFLDILDLATEKGMREITELGKQGWRVIYTVGEHHMMLELEINKGEQMR